MDFAKEIVAEDRLRRLPNTEHFTFLGDLTKPAVTIACVNEFLSSLAAYLQLDVALLA